MTPRKLKAFNKAYEIKRKIDDEKAYLQGIYNLKAFEVVIAHFASGFSKRKCDAEYFKDPLLSKKQDGEFTDRELDIQRNLFVAKLMAMKTNFELNNKISNGNR